MKYLIIAFLILFVHFHSFSQTPDFQVKQKWATEQVFKTPESVFFDSLRNIVYVSNINQFNPNRKDGDGFISRLDISGKVVQLQWITGLNDPKGMGMHGNKLFVADLDELVEIDIEKSTVVKKHKIPGARFLNDVSVDRSGDVYVSDSEEKVVFKVTKGVPLVWIGKDGNLQRPNGLYVERERILVADFDAGKIFLVNPVSKEMREWVSGIEAADGIARAGNSYFVSNWNGEVYHVNFNGDKTKIIDTKEEKVGAADIEHINSLNILLVPTFFDNRVVAYDIVPNN